MKTFNAAVASDDTYQLGEGPVWDAVRNRVLWVDIDAGDVLAGELHDGRVVCTQRHSFGPTVGAVVCSNSGQLLVARTRDLTVLDTDGQLTPSIEVLPADQGSRFNDGACDPSGRFLIGSMALDDREHSDCLWRLEDDRTVTVIDSDLTLSNGLAWSPTGTLMYSIDSVPGIVWVRDYHAIDGQTGPRSVLLRITDATPDGMCVDVDGNLWIAIWGAGQVRCYSPEGERLATVEVAAPHTSSVAFVGPDLDTLLITTAVRNLSPAQRCEFPDSGRLFVADVGTRGLPCAPWSSGDVVS